MLPLPSFPVDTESWWPGDRYTVDACANPVFGAPDCIVGGRLRRVLLSCLAGDDSGQLDHDRITGVVVLDQTHLYNDDDEHHDPPWVEHD
jgi:hypothetical protein